MSIYHCTTCQKVFGSLTNHYPSDTHLNGLLDALHDKMEQSPEETIRVGGGFVYEANQYEPLTDAYPTDTIKKITSIFSNRVRPDIQTHYSNLYFPIAPPSIEESEGRPFIMIINPHAPEAQQNANELTIIRNAQMTIRTYSNLIEGLKEKSAGLDLQKTQIHETISEKLRRMGESEKAIEAAKQIIDQRKKV